MAKKPADKTTVRTAQKKGAAKRRAAAKDKNGYALEARLREAVEIVDAADVLTNPLRRSIKNLLTLAAHSLGSDEASVLVRDDEGGSLRFLVAIGEVADELVKLRIPPGKGVAGFVFASGQPVVVADVSQDETFYPEVDRATGYSTQTLLATPLRVGEEMVGVLEFVNRIGEPPYRPFTPDEMDKAAHFADAIATLVEAHESAGLIETLFERSLGAKAAPKGAAKKNESPQPQSPTEDLQKWLKRVRTAPEHRDLLSLAVSLSEIASRGEAERQLCREVVEALARWTERRTVAGAPYFGF